MHAAWPDGQCGPPEPDGYLLLAADLPGLTSLHAHPLAGVANALALIRLRLANRANIGRDLAHHMFVDAGDAELGRAIHGERDALRRVHLDWMREAHLKDQILADLR